MKAPLLPKSVSISRGQAEKGLGEGPGDQSFFGEQYLGYGPPFDRRDVLDRLRIWMTLDGREEDHAALRHQLCAWSVLTLPRWIVIARLMSNPMFRRLDTRAAYHAHGRAFPLDPTASVDPAVVLGRGSAFQGPLATGEPEEVGFALPPGLDAVRADPRRATRLLVAVQTAVGLQRPLIVGAPLAAFRAGGALPELVAFSRAAMPPKLRARLPVRLYTSQPRLFLAEMANGGILAVPDDLMDPARHARADAVLLDWGDAAIRNANVHPLIERYATTVVEKYLALPLGLTPFSILAEALAPRGPSSRLVLAAADVYDAACIRWAGGADLASLLRVALSRGDTAGYPWRDLLPPEHAAWTRLDTQELSAILAEASPAPGPEDSTAAQLRAIAEGELRARGVVGVPRIAVGGLAPSRMWTLPPDQLAASLASLAREGGRAAALGVVRSRLLSEEAPEEREAIVRCAISGKSDLLTGTMLIDERGELALPPDWVFEVGNLLLKDPGVRARVRLHTIERIRAIAGASTPEIQALAEGLIDAAVDGPGSEAALADLIRAEGFESWFRRLRSAALARNAAIRWLSSPLWSDLGASPFPGDWTLVLDTLEVLTAEEAQLAFPPMTAGPWRNDKLARATELCERCGDDNALLRVLDSFVRSGGDGRRLLADLVRARPELERMLLLLPPPRTGGARPTLDQLRQASTRWPDRREELLRHHASILVESAHDPAWTALVEELGVVNYPSFLRRVYEFTNGRELVERVSRRLPLIPPAQWRDAGSIPGPRGWTLAYFSQIEMLRTLVDGEPLQAAVQLRMFAEKLGAVLDALAPAELERVHQSAGNWVSRCDKPKAFGVVDSERSNLPGLDVAFTLAESASSRGPALLPYAWMEMMVRETDWPQDPTWWRAAEATFRRRVAVLARVRGASVSHATWAFLSASACTGAGLVHQRAMAVRLTGDPVLPAAGR